jgi:hypothetical protein
VYVIEPHGNSVFADARLPFEPVAAVMDLQPDRPGEDRTQLVALADDGRVASIDVGSNAFGWRLPGVLMGALTAVLIYLLARFLFRRRSVALVAGALALVEGMLFANSRIAMNDVYVTGFIVAAATLFVPLWLGSWRRWWQILLGLIGIGLLLGLALASKWVAAYAIGGIVLLVLLRSMFGRVIALAGMLGLSAVLGALAIRPAEVEDPNRNWLFLIVMLSLTVALAAAMIRRPVRFTASELRFAVLAPVLVGAALIAAVVVFGAGSATIGPFRTSTLLIAGGASVAAGIAIGVLAWADIGPFASRRVIGPDDPIPTPPPNGWLNPGRLLGLPWLFALGCIGLLPIVVYAVSYLPWIQLGNQWWEGAPAGHTSQTLMNLTVSMYDYHNDLRVPHAASSPWWAWPLNLKPVWWFQDSFANDTTGAIYDGGNLVVFWIGIAALAFAAICAWRRRSLSLTLVVLMFAAMWLPWTRIDRATFQYHWYAALPFVVLALGYLVAELWHGPSRLGWTFARIGAAAAIIGAPLLWLLRQPLCTLADVAGANANAAATVCGEATRSIQLSEQAFAAYLVILVGIGVGAWLMWSGATRSGSDRRPQRRGMGIGSVTGLLLVAGATLLGVFGALMFASPDQTFELQISADVLAFGALLLLLVPALMVLRARDSRKVAIGIVGAAALFFIAWYPNLSGLPIPTGIANQYLGLLPTWNYDFQFDVNRDPPPPGGLIDETTYVVAVAGVILILIAMVSAWLWGRLRARRAEPLAEPA